MDKKNKNMIAGIAITIGCFIIASKVRKSKSGKYKINGVDIEKDNMLSDEWCPILSDESFVKSKNNHYHKFVYDFFSDKKTRNKTCELYVEPNRLLTINECMNEVLGYEVIIDKVIISESNLIHIRDNHMEGGIHYNDGDHPIRLDDVLSIPDIINFGSIYEGFDNRGNIESDYRPCLRLVYQGNMELLVGVVSDRIIERLSNKKNREGHINIEMVTEYVNKQ